MEGDHRGNKKLYRRFYFNPLPPHGGRLGRFCRSKLHFFISIHSLRMEGDEISEQKSELDKLFQSTPSAWRETVRYNQTDSLEQ